MTRLRLSIPEQNARRKELERIRGQRSLDPAEEAEYDRLDRAFYLRSWRADFQDKHGLSYTKHRQIRVPRQSVS